MTPADGRIAAMNQPIVIRQATAADGPMLAAIERGSPLELQDASIAIDRGDDYFASSRLMGSPTVLVAEVDGVPAGVIGGVVHAAPLGGEVRRMLYIHHARILPSYQNTGVGRRLSAALMEHLKPGGYDSPYWYIARENARSQAFARNAANRWSFGPTWVTLDCAANAGPPYGRVAGPADAAQIVQILNACHEGEEMFLPYTVESFTARLARDPVQYGWPHVWRTDGAVVGVWPEGDWIAVSETDGSGEVTSSRGAGVLDYGFLPGAGEEARALLRAWCGWLLERGMTSLDAFTSDGSRTRPLFDGLRCELAVFDFWTPGLPEPAGAHGRGLYVDHVYF